MVMVKELMVDGDEGGEDGLRIPPPGEKSWIILSPKMKIVVAAALCFAKAPPPLGQPLFRIYEGVRESRRRGGARGGIWPRGPHPNGPRAPPRLRSSTYPLIYTEKCVT